MKKSLLLSSAAILLLGMSQNFDGQEKPRSHRQQPGGGDTGIARQSETASAPLFSRQERNRWTTDQNLPDRYRLTKPWGHRDDGANATMTGKTLTQHELSAGVDTAWVRHYASGFASGYEAANALAVDGTGNIYVTGWGNTFSSGVGYLTMKYDSAGSQLWAARYHGPGDGLDWATALTVDVSGNVYVTGISAGSGTGDDFATVKYNSAGVEQWVARYNGPGNSSDNANALAVDASGNVYVTGESIGSGTGWDFATVKYNSAGVEQWVARYNGPGNSGDGANALTVDDSGNVFVAGWSYGSGTDFDFATVKYNSEGIEQWVARYNGPGNLDDGATGLAVDAFGNVYVTGASPGSGTEYDFATVEYNSAGVEQWVARYNGPGNAFDFARALAVDTSSNVYVTGSSQGSGTSSDYATVKYNSEGVEQWVARYNCPENADDGAYALAVDAFGNVYVTGRSTCSSEHYATVKYNSAGVEQWVARYDGPAYSNNQAHALAVDTSGNVYVTGWSEGSGTGWDFVTVKYNSAGVEQWVARYDGRENTLDQAYALAVDASGDIYVTGSSLGSGTADDFATVKYNSAGVEQWVARYNGPGNAWDQASALAVDVFGNIYVTGSSAALGNFPYNYDYATMKYNSTGVEQWVARYNGPRNDRDRANALAVDASGNAYVTGASRGLGSADNYDFATIKYNSAGVEQWVARYNGPGNASDNAHALSVDSSGNVYVTGSSDGSGTLRDFATVKYNSAGEEQWVARYNGPENSSDDANALAVDASGNVYVTGESHDSGTGWDFATVKYNSAGVEQWVARYNGPGNSGDNANALAVDAPGNVYVTGLSDGSGTGWDFATIKYNSAGVEQWVARYDGPGDTWERANALAVDASGNVYVTGRSEESGTGDKFVTVKYNSAGAEQWVARYDGSGYGFGYARALAVDASGNVYVAGSSTSGYGYESLGWSIYTTIKYVQTPVSVESEASSGPRAYELSQNYPNPFNPNTTIEFSLPKPGFVALKIYNTLGNEVATLISEKLPAGKHQRVWEAKGLASGVYLYRLEAGEFAQTRKLILLR